MYNSILDILNCSEEEIIATAEIAALEPDLPEINAVFPTIKCYEFNEADNFSDPAVRDRFKNEHFFDECELFTAPVNTTSTLEGYLSNTTFHEADLIKLIEPSADVVLARCNFGKVVFNGYTEIVKVPKSSRGRKKKKKDKKYRKQQGLGTDFNSQLTLFVLSRDSLTMFDENGDEFIRVDAPVYKFKVFRNGMIQLPGMRQSTIEDVMECAKIVTSTINNLLHNGEKDISKTTMIINAKAVMKNYKFLVKMPAGMAIDLIAMNSIIGRDFMNKANKIYDFEYICQKNRLYIRFKTPITDNFKKRTRVKIFASGKINILGALYADSTYEICQYLCNTIRNNRHKLITELGDIVYKIPLRENNIQMLESPVPYTDWIPKIEPLPVNICADFIRLCHKSHAEYTRQANKICDQLIRDHFSCQYSEAVFAV